MTAVLHTWGQTLVRHVHLHCLVPGGAVTPAGAWHPARSTYLFPVRALSRHFRGAFVSRLRRVYAAGALARIRDPDEVEHVLDALMGCDWVVYAKPRALPASSGIPPSRMRPTKYLIGPMV